LGCVVVGCVAVEPCGGVIRVSARIRLCPRHYVEFKARADAHIWYETKFPGTGLCNVEGCDKVAEHLIEAVIDVKTKDIHM